MVELLEYYQNQVVVVFVLVLARVGGLVMTAPVLGAKSTPIQVRGLLAVALALIITPLHFSQILVEMPESMVGLVAVVAAEAAVGVTMGLSIAILFTGVQIVGTLIGQMAGTRLADLVDPNSNESVAVYSQLLDFVTVAIFLMIGGHRQVLDALLNTFSWMPPGEAVFTGPLLETLTGIVAQSFVLGIRGAAPAIVAVMLSLLVLALISRTLPQLNVLVLGFSVNAMLAIAAIGSTVGAVGWIFQDQVGPTLDAVREMYSPIVDS